MKSYLVIDGKRIDLTEEQIRILTEEKKEDIIHRAVGYFFIDSEFNVIPWADGSYPSDKERFEKGNYYPNQGEYEKTQEYYNLVAQDALHDELRSRLRMFTRNHGWDENVWYNYHIDKWYISEDITTHDYATKCTWYYKKMIYILLQRESQIKQ